MPGFLDNIRKNSNARTGGKPPTTKYFGSIGNAAKAAFERGKGHEVRSHVITYHHPDDIPASGASQYGALGIGGATGPNTWSVMIIGEAFASTKPEDREGVPTPDYLPYDTIKPGAATARPIVNGMSSDEAYGDEFAEGVVIALKDPTYGKLVESFLREQGRI